MKVSKKDFDDLLECVGYKSEYLSDGTIRVSDIRNLESGFYKTQEDAVNELEAKGYFEEAFLKEGALAKDISVPDYRTALKICIENEMSKEAKAISTLMFLIM